MCSLSDAKNRMALEFTLHVKIFISVLVFRDLSCSTRNKRAHFDFAKTVPYHVSHLRLPISVP